MFDPVCDAGLDGSHDDEHRRLRRAIADRVMCSSGEDFLSVTADAIGEAFDADLVLLTRVRTAGEPVEAIGLYDRRNQFEAVCGWLQDTPCQIAFKRKRSIAYRRGASKQPAKDEALRDLGLEAFASAPLLLENGDCVGLIVCVWSRPIDQERRYLAVLEDIAGRLAREVLHHERQTQFDIADSRADFGLWFVDLALNTISYSSKAQEIVGLSRGVSSIELKRVFAWLEKTDQKRAQAAIDAHLDHGAPLDLVLRVPTVGSTSRWIRMTGSASRDAAGAPVSLAGSLSDVTELIEARESALAAAKALEAARECAVHDALHDSLTELPNRRHLDQRLIEVIASASAETVISTIHVDLDRFKQINDTLGHAAGDHVLILVADRLRELAREGDFVARVGGDEFVILCAAGSDLSAVDAIAQKIVSDLAKPVSFDGRQCHFGASVGVASAPADDAASLLINADIALYEAKKAGRNRVSVFTRTLQTQMLERQQVADEVRRGLENDEFIAFYQPQFDARTHAFVGMEALARWRHPTRGMLAPFAFLDIFEDLNLVSRLDRLILQRAIADCRALEAAGVAIPKVSVNASLDRLAESSLIDDVRNVDLAGATLAFELLETVFFDERHDQVFWFIDRLRENGVEIEVDDFGSGRASIVGLLKINPTRLKIDRQLVSPITRSPRQLKLLQAIVEIGRSQGISITAEGVETLEHAQILRDLGCDTLQGYAFARPMPADELRDFLTANAWPRSA